MIRIFFHSFSEDRVVHQLKEISLEVLRCFRSKVCVELDVALKPRLLFETYTAMNLLNLQTNV